MNPTTFTHQYEARRTTKFNQVLTTRTQQTHDLTPWRLPDALFPLLNVSARRSDPPCHSLPHPVSLSTFGFTLTPTADDRCCTRAALRTNLRTRDIQSFWFSTTSIHYITLNLPTHLWIETHPRFNLDIDSRCRCIGRRNPLEIFSKFDRLRARSISTILSARGCFCLYRYVFCPRFPQVTRTMINCCAMVYDLDFNHSEKEHTQQTGHRKLKAGPSDQVLAKGDRESDV